LNQATGSRILRVLSERRVGREDLGLPGREAWRANRAELAAAVAPLTGAGDIAARREALEPVTHALWRALHRFGTRRSGPVRLFHCPMAHDNTGADWLQLEPTVANPYFGASMLRCGSQTDSLVAGGGS